VGIFPTRQSGYEMTELTSPTSQADSPVLNKLKGIVAGGLLASRITVEAVHDLTQHGGSADEASVQHLLGLLRRALPDRTALQTRQSAGAAVMEGMLWRAAALAPMTGSLHVVLGASQTVLRSTEHVLTDEEIRIMALGQHLSDEDLVVFRQALLCHGGIREQMSKEARTLLTDADRALEAAASPAWHNPNSVRGVQVIDQMVASNDDLDYRLGAVLLGQGRPITSAEFVDWVSKTRPALLATLMGVAKVLLMEGECPQDVVFRVAVLMAGAVHQEGAEFLAEELIERENVSWKVSVSVVREAVRLLWSEAF
jgi:hypothetical protein